jgi:hypothetical protein
MPRQTYLVINTTSLDIEAQQQDLIIRYIKEHYPKTKFIRTNGLIHDASVLTKRADDNGIVFWTPANAIRNVDYLKVVGFNIVVLLSPTNIYSGVSLFNPFDENHALNHNVYITYAYDSITSDITDERKFVVGMELYTLTYEAIVSMINEKIHAHAHLKD